MGLKNLSVIFDSLRNDDISKSHTYFSKHKSSLLGLFAFSRFTAFSGDYSKVEDDFSKLPTWAKNSPDGKNIYSKIQGAKTAKIGTVAKGFIQQSSTDESISLESYKGKYVLLDFWASWCGPCRKEHPNLIKAFQKYGPKNFTILSISLDDNKNLWLDAIKYDQLKWLNISDLKGQQNEIALKYGVQTIPANFLISPEGVIIDKNLSGESLINKLNILLK